MTWAAAQFAAWLTGRAAVPSSVVDDLRLEGAFEVLSSRCAAARKHGSQKPLLTISPKGAGGNSRQCTRAMLRQLGYSERELRVVHRLMGGSPSGWAGLISIFVQRRPLTAAEISYVRKQIRLIRPTTR